MHTTKLISEPDTEITGIEEEIKSIMDEINSPILKHFSFHMHSIILAIIGGFL